MNTSTNFQNKVDAIERQLDADILKAQGEMFPIGSEQARRRYDAGLRRNGLRKAIENALKDIAFQQSFIMTKFAEEKAIIEAARKAS